MDELPTIEFPSHGKLKASSWRIHQKIGYGYFLAIGIGFFGSLTGFVIANYYRGREIRQFNQVKEQGQLLAQYKDAVIEAQLDSSYLVAVLGDDDRLTRRKAEFLSSVVQARSLEHKINGFIDSKPRQLAATRTSLQSLLLDYSINLKSYVNQIDTILGQLTPAHSQPEQTKVREQLLTVMRGETAMQLEQLSNKLSDILQTAQEQEQAQQKDVEQAKSIERLIFVVSMLISAAIAAVVAWRTESGDRRTCDHCNSNS